MDSRAVAPYEMSGRGLRALPRFTPYLRHEDAGVRLFLGTAL